MKTKVSHSTYISTRELSRKGGSMEPLEPWLNPPLQLAKTDAEILQQSSLPPRVDPSHKASF